MQEIIKILIGITVLIGGFPLGYFLAKITQEELPSGQKWFKLIILISLISATMSLILHNDALFFSFLFFAVVASASLRYKK